MTENEALLAKALSIVALQLASEWEDTLTPSDSTVTEIMAIAIEKAKKIS